MTEKRIVNVICYIVLLIGISFLLGAGQNKKLEEVTVVHIVRQGETMHQIGERYLPKGGYLLEFVEGIYELNYDRVFAKREKNGSPKKSIYVGDELEIHYWR